MTLWHDVSADLRFGLRCLLREPGFTATVVVVFALGIGANVTILSAIDAVLLRPLPYAGEQRLVELFQQDARQGSRRDPVSPANFLDWRGRAAGAVTLAAAEPFSRTLRTADGPVRLRSWLVTENLFEILSLPPLIGRTFTPDEFTAGRDGVVVLGYATWSRQFARDPKVIGQAIVMDGQPFTIIGVMPAEFALPPGRDVWSPKIFTDGDRQQRASSYFRVVGALEPGVEPPAAQARLDVIAA